MGPWGRDSGGPGPVLGGLGHNPPTGNQRNQPNRSNNQPMGAKKHPINRDIKGDFAPQAAKTHYFQYFPLLVGGSFCDGVATLYGALCTLCMGVTTFCVGVTTFCVWN